MERSGVFKGRSTNYSGEGFSKMDFEFLALDQDGYDSWVSKVKAEGTLLDTPELQHLNHPTIDAPVTYYNGFDDNTWTRVVNQCIGATDLCLNDMMMVDALGGGGVEGLFNRELYRGICSADDPRALMDILRPDLIDRAGEIFPHASNLLPVSQPDNGDH
jgi:cytochrome o ubiquinol oxidase subunit 2